MDQDSSSRLGKPEQATEQPSSVFVTYNAVAWRPPIVSNPTWRVIHRFHRLRSAAAFTPAEAATSVSPHEDVLPACRASGPSGPSGRPKTWNRGRAEYAIVE